MLPSNCAPEDLYDIAIVGAGPVGLYAAYYAGLRQMRTVIIDSLPELGGTVYSALYPEKYIYDVAGFPQIWARDLVQNLTKQMMQYNPTIVLEEKVDHLTPGDIVTLTAVSGAVYRTKCVLITAGVGAFAPRKPHVPSLERFEGRGVHYAIRDRSLIAGKRLLIAGGGDSAFDWAMNLATIAKSITLIHRSDKFRAHEDTVIKVLTGGHCDVRTFNEIKELHGDGHLEAVTLFDNRTDEDCRIEVDDLLLTLGFLTDIGSIKQWELEIRGNSIVVDFRGQTNLPHVFAAGDICTYEGKLKLISIGFGEAATAVNHAKADIDPSAKAFPGHASDTVPNKHVALNP